VAVHFYIMAVRTVITGGGVLYKRIVPKKLTGQEPFINTGGKQFTVLDFWRYAFSGLNSNVLRGTLAEYIVETALRDVKDIVIRNSWGDWDVMTEDGIKIEVKCCSYIQDWDQNDYSKVVFSGLKAKELYWSEAVKSYKDLAEAAYKADVYILCLVHHKDHATLDILNMDQWSFYILSRYQIAEVASNGKSVSIDRLMKHNIEPVSYKAISTSVQNLK
jgi:hypothetical protein